MAPHSQDKPNGSEAKVSGAKLASCGVELLKIVDVGDWPEIADKSARHFSQPGCQMVRSR